MVVASMDIISRAFSSRGIHSQPARVCNVYSTRVYALLFSMNNNGKKNHIIIIII